jgi:hypothetical protein
MRDPFVESAAAFVRRIERHALIVGGHDLREKSVSR